MRLRTLALPLLALRLAAQQPEPRHESVVVTGTYEPLPLEESDRSVEVLPAGQPVLFRSLADLLRLDPALDLQQRAPGAVQADLSIRGGTFGQTLILLDGLRLNDAQSGHHNMDIPVPLEAISRLEVLHGSGSTLYGSDAVGGVVNVITRQPEHSELRFQAAGGSFGSNSQSITAGLATDRWSQEVTASRSFSSGFAPDRDYRNLSLFSASHVRSSWGYTNVLLGHGDRPFGAAGFYGNFDSWERTRTWLAALQQQLGSRTTAEVSFRRHSDLFVLYRDRPQVFTNRHAVESVSGALRRVEELGPTWKLFYGGEGLREAIDSSNLGRHARARGAAYAALDVRALRRFSFSAGAREEIYSSGPSQFSPSLAGGAWLSSHLKARASLSRAFRLPSYTELYYHDPASLGSPDLRPESAWSGEAGLDWNAGRWRGDVAVFQRREHDGIDFARRSTADLWRAINIQRLRFTGVEAAAGVRLGSAQQIDFRYSALHGAQAALAGLHSRYAFNYPVNSGVLAWQGALPRGWMARTRVGVLDRYGRDPYGLWEIHLARTRGRLHPFIEAANVTNTRYQEVTGVAMPGRAFYGGVEIVVLQ